MKPTILIASDHAGFELKNHLIGFLMGKGYKVEDLGPKIFDKDDDYPKTITPLAFKIAGAEVGTYMGIVIGKSGQGEAMVCNRFPGVRAVVFYGGKDEVIELSKEHNDANVLALGAGLISKEEAEKAVELWLTTPFSGEERHIRRMEELDNIQ